MRLWTAAFSLLVIIGLAGCGSFAGAGQTDSSGRAYQALGTITASATADWASIDTGGMRLTNNVWNKVHASLGPSFQEIFTEDIAGEAAFGWDWEWPMSGDVVSYPEIVYGTKPWDMGSAAYPTGQALPFQAGSKSIDATFDIRSQFAGAYDMAFSLWAVHDPAHPKDTISHEIMIWNDNEGGTPAGNYHDSLTVDGRDFGVYLNEDQHDNSGSTNATWTYVAFAPQQSQRVAQQPLLSGHLSLSAFVDYLVGQNIMTTNDYITSVELGNEVLGGTGMIEVRGYSIVIQQER
jgi:hypothetical protein